MNREIIETPERDVQSDYTKMLPMYRRVYMCKSCGKKNVIDIFATTPAEKRLYFSQLTLTQRCPKCYIDLMRGSENDN